ncbi:MAG: class I SAM-dependent methyltransferase family protein [Nanoarchaeota archaeon]|nr:class I SAM-dependent methyltransferase family protein [Nanoarchaeota archaeon]
MNLREALIGKIPPNQLANLPKSFDIIGDIAILDIPSELLRWSKWIVKTILETHPRLQTILVKTGERSGPHRLRTFEVIYGGTTETTHIEYGYRLFMDVATVYFSPREGEERQRVASAVKKKEQVLLLFAGVGPYAIAIAKKQPKVKIVAVEINPHGFYYLCQNAMLNKVDKQVTPILGDAKHVLAEQKHHGKYHRVIMPLPKEGHLFLEDAIRSLRHRGWVHFYTVERESTSFAGAKRTLKDACKKAGYKLVAVTVRKVLPYGPRQWKVCLDAQVEKKVHKRKKVVRKKAVKKAIRRKRVRKTWVARRKPHRKPVQKKMRKRLTKRRPVRKRYVSKRVVKRKPTKRRKR